MIEADGKAQKIGTKSGSPPLPREGRSKMLYPSGIAAVAVGALPPPSRRK